MTASGGYICVGWEAVGDLALFDTKQAFRTAFRDHYPLDGNEAAVMQQSDQPWRLTQLRLGDKVVANRGATEVLALGTVDDTGY